MITLDPKYIDALELVTTAPQPPDGAKDGGDSAHKCAHYALSIFPRGCSEQHYYERYARYYGLMRHPDSSKWYSNPRTFSRDQFAAQLIYAAYSAHTRYLDFLFKAHSKRLFLLAWNTLPSWGEALNAGPIMRVIQRIFGKDENWKFPDLTLFDVWGAYIRGYQCRILYPLLFIFDLIGILPDAIIKRFDSDFDINNSLGYQLLGMDVMPTGIGHLAYWIMKPVVERKLLQYWDAARYEPPIGEIMIARLKSEGRL